MKTAIGELPFQLWVFIVIVVVGSVCLITTIAIITRCCMLKRRSKTQKIHEDLGPMRRVTVRRGRMVPASHHESLTGSRFGLNQFEDNDTIKTGRKSPFDFLSSNKRDSRRGKSVDEMTESSFRAKSPSASAALYGSEFSQSTQSLDKYATTTIQEVDEPPDPEPAVRPARNTSFSRPFPRTPTSPFPRPPQLSMIEESSPHTSYISTRSARQSSGIPHFDSSMSRIDPNRSTPSTRRSSNNHTPSMLSNIQVNVDAPRSSALTSSTTASLRGFPTPPTAVPMPISYRGSRSSLGETEVLRPSLSHHSSLSRHDSPVNAHDQNSEWPSAPAPLEQSYWGSRPDLKPIGRSTSKKGNVLRKKSLKRQEVLSAMAH